MSDVHSHMWMVKEYNIITQESFCIVDWENTLTTRLLLVNVCWNNTKVFMPAKQYTYNTTIKVLLTVHAGTAAQPLSTEFKKNNLCLIWQVS